MPVQFGLGLVAGPPKDKIYWWRDTYDTVLSDLVGYCDSIWMTDHFFWGNAPTFDDPTYEAWTVLAYLSARWPQFDIGPMVLGQSYRNPALLAKMAATLHTLNDGRLILGIGAGWKEDEYRAYGYPFPSAGVRLAQLEDALEIITRLWTEDGPVTYSGDHYSIKNAWCEPRPDPSPVLMVGGGGTKTMRLAARFADWWNLHDAPWDAYRARMAVLDQHCAELDRDPASIRRTWYGRLVLGETPAAALALGAGKWTPENAFVGTPAQVIDQMTPFVEGGVDYFMLELLGLPGFEILQMFREEIIPAFA